MNKLNFKKLVCAAAALVMVAVCLVGCGKSDAKRIIGEWRGTVDVGEQMGIDGSCEATYILTFDEKEVKLSIDTDAFSENLSELMRDLLNEQMEGENLTEADIETALGMTFDELISTTVDSAIEELESEMKDASGEYTIEDGVLTVDDEESDYEFVSDNELKIDMDDLGEVTFKKQ